MSTDIEGGAQELRSSSDQADPASVEMGTPEVRQQPEQPSNRPVEELSDKEPKPGHSSSMNVANVHGTAIGQANVEQFFSSTLVLGAGADYMPAAKLEYSDFILYRLDALQRQLRDTIFEPEEIDGLVMAARRSRFLLIQGPVGIGKTQIALQTGLRLCESGHVESVLLSRTSPGRQRVVDLLSFTADTRLKNSVILISSALREGNQSLVKFMKSANPEELRDLKNMLTEQGSFLIIGFAEEHRPQLSVAIEQTVCKLDGPGREKIIQHLQVATMELIRREAQAEDKAKMLQRFQQLIARNVTSILDRLQGVSRVSSFVSTHMLAVLAQDDWEIALEKSLLEADRLDHWLLETLAEDAETLAFVLALAVCNSGQSGSVVRWFTFEQVRYAVLAVLRRETGDEERRQVQTLCRETEILQKIGATVEAGEAKGPLIRFLDESRAERIWATLQGAGRALAALLLPKLKELCLQESFAVRRHAAWAVARISLLDPLSILIPLMSRWLDKSEFRARLAVGALLQGAAFSGSEDLCRLAFSRLENELRTPGTGRRKLRAISALGEVALVDLDWVLEQLRQVAKRDLKVRLALLKDIDQERRLVEIDVGRAFGDLALQQNLGEAFDKQMAQVLDDLFPLKSGSFELLAALQYVLIGQIFEREPLEIFLKLGAWMPLGREVEQLAPLLALIFLRDRGVLDVVERYPEAFPSKDTSTLESGYQGKPSSRILISAFRSEQGERDLADFLFRLYLGARWYPPGIAQGLTYQLLLWLTKLTRKEANSPLRGTVASLWGELANCPSQEFRDSQGDVLDRLEFDGRQAVRSLVQELRSAHFCK